MWDILTEYSAALSGSPLQLAGGMSPRSLGETQAAAPACLPQPARSVLGRLWDKVSRP